MLEDSALIEKVGIVNANCENRNWGGDGVSDEQPSIIDDLSIKSGFYDCPALGIVCVPKRMAAMVNGIGSAFVSAENMVMEAYELGVSSCIVGRAEVTFSHPEMAELLTQSIFLAVKQEKSKYFVRKFRQNRSVKPNSLKGHRCQQ